MLELGSAIPSSSSPTPIPSRRAAAPARVVSSGQSCIAATASSSRAIAEPFTRALVDVMRCLRVGDPLRAETQVGPLARADLRDEVAQQVARSVAAGARCLTGGDALPGPGWFYAPTVLADVRPGMAAFDEEVFGPVAAVTAAADPDEAVALAKRTRYGLGASVWTRDPARAETLARRLDAGMVFINEAVRSDPRLPFGGVKRSGYGRELSHYGIREFTNVRTIVVAAPSATPTGSSVE